MQNYAVVTGLNPATWLNSQQILDVAVPGFFVADLVELQPSCNPNPGDPIEVMAAKILKPDCYASPVQRPTQLDVAAALKPTTAILWVGSNDVLFSLLFGTDPTDRTAFGASFHTAARTMAGASEHLVVANIPDVTLTAYLTSVAKLAAILNLPVGDMKKKLGLDPHDMVTPYVFPVIKAMGSSLTVLPDSVLTASGSPVPIVIRTAMLSQIRAAVIAYNAAIAAEAADNGATLVDIYSLIKNLAAKGVVVGGQKLTTDFMGGLFSLDGVHPTNTGYAIIANEFIKTMNASLGAHIPYVSVEQVMETDPPIIPQSAPGKDAGHVSVGMADGLRVLGGRRSRSADLRQ